MGTSVTDRYAVLTQYHRLFGRLLGLLIATIVTISCAHSQRAPATTALVLVALPPSATFEKPEAADENFCTDPAKYPKRGFGTAADTDVRTVKEIFGADPDETSYWINQEFGMTATIPGKLTFENRDKERSPAPFFRHRIEFTPQQTGRELPEPGSRRVFGNNAKIVAMTVVQEERTL